MFDKDDAKKLASAGIFSLIDLALEAPKSYEDTRLSKTFLHNGGILCANACSCGFSIYAKTLNVRLFLPDLDEFIEAVFFNYKPYIKSVFAKDKTMIIYGTIKSGAKPQIVHPKILNNAGFIHAVYNPPFNRAFYIQMRQKYIKSTSFEALGLPSNYAKILELTHFPNDKILNDYHNNESKNILEALKFAEIFNRLRELKKRKIEFNAKALSVNNPQDFYTKLPYTPTLDQIKTIDEIANDLTKPKQMRRLVIGDVGSGKTLVMLCAAWLIAPIKTILMAPTTVLANQIFEQAKELDFKTVLVTNSTNIQDDELKNYDLIIGTHALLYKQLPSAGLIIVDEQHRFGVNQRGQISKLTEEASTKPHYLQCSATPIPRTQALMQAQMIDVSLIKTLPFEKNIKSIIMSKPNFATLLAHIDEQVKADRQVAIIYPLVEESENFNYQSIEEGAPFWQKRYAKVVVTHGKDKNKEDALEQFKTNGNILISTTVIEVGISLPKLDTIVIVGAERLGLASLHQLRGRVGRYGNLGYCYLYTNSPANERLIEFCKIKDGFEVAELDLKFRSGGDLVTGKRQSGAEFRYFDQASDYKLAEAALKLLY